METQTILLVEDEADIREGMGGSCQIENMDGKYRIALFFPKADGANTNKESGDT